MLNTNERSWDVDIKQLRQQIIEKLPQHKSTVDKLTDRRLLKVYDKAIRINRKRKATLIRSAGQKKKDRTTHVRKKSISSEPVPVGEISRDNIKTEVK